MTHSSFATITARDTRRTPRGAAHLPALVAAVLLIVAAIAWHAIFGLALSALR